MPRCALCGTRYQLTQYNSSSECQDCVDVLDSTDQVEIGLLINPSGKTPAKIYDRNSRDSYYDDTDDQS